jgi:hypothetical protein
MTTGQEYLPSSPRRLKAFANFFRGYMRVSSLVIAALPIPVTALEALPVFADQKGTASFYSSLLCFLTLAYIFYMRHSFAKWMFPRDLPADTTAARTAIIKSTLISALPIIFIALSLPSALSYSFFIHRVINEIAFIRARPISSEAKCQSLLNSVDESNINPLLVPEKINLLARDCKVLSRSEILKASYPSIPHGSTLLYQYILMFVTAEAAFVLMATREYIQDLLRISDYEVISSKSREA